MKRTVAVIEAGAYLIAACLAQSKRARYMALPHGNQGTDRDPAAVEARQPTPHFRCCIRAGSCRPLCGLTDWVAECSPDARCLAADETDPVAASCGVYASTGHAYAMTMARRRLSPQAEPVLGPNPAAPSQPARKRQPSTRWAPGVVRPMARHAARPRKPP